jgi:hypothetical protein
VFQKPKSCRAKAADRYSANPSLWFENMPQVQGPATESVHRISSLMSVIDFE